MPSVALRAAFDRRAARNVCDGRIMHKSESVLEAVATGEMSWLSWVRPANNREVRVDRQVHFSFGFETPCKPIDEVLLHDHHGSLKARARRDRCLSRNPPGAAALVVVRELTVSGKLRLAADERRVVRERAAI